MACRRASSASQSITFSFARATASKNSLCDASAFSKAWSNSSRESGAPSGQKLPISEKSAERSSSFFAMRVTLNDERRGRESRTSPCSNAGTASASASAYSHDTAQRPMRLKRGMKMTSAPAFIRSNALICAIFAGKHAPSAGTVVSAACSSAVPRASSGVITLNPSSANSARQNGVYS